MPLMEIGDPSAQARSLVQKIELRPKELRSDLPSLGFAGLAVGSALSVVGFFEFSVWFCHDFAGFVVVIVWNSAQFWRFAPRVGRTADREIRKNSRQSGGWEVIFDLSFAQQIAYYFLRRGRRRFGGLLVARNPVGSRAAKYGLSTSFLRKFRIEVAHGDFGYT